MAASRLVNRNITATAGRTSMRLEPEVWEALREICLRENKDRRELIRAVEGGAASGGRTSAVRVHVLQYFRAAATRDGHLQAGHGSSAGIPSDEPDYVGADELAHLNRPPSMEDAHASLDA